MEMKKARPDVSDLAGKKISVSGKRKDRSRKKVSIPASVWWIFCYVTLLRWFESLQTGPGSFKNVTPRRPYFGPQDAKKARNSGLFSYLHHFWQVNLERAKGIEPSYSAWEADVLPLNYARKSYCVVYYTPWEGKSQSRIEKNAGRAGDEM